MKEASCRELKGWNYPNLEVLGTNDTDDDYILQIWSSWNRRSKHLDPVVFIYILDSLHLNILLRTWFHDVHSEKYFFIHRWSQRTPLLWQRYFKTKFVHLLKPSSWFPAKSKNKIGSKTKLIGSLSPISSKHKNFISQPTLTFSWVDASGFLIIGTDICALLSV